MNSDNERHRDKYNEVLEELCDRHRLHDKLLRIHNIPLEEEERFVEEMNKWDKEMEDCMKAAEKKAVKKRNVQQKLEWSPYVGLWIRRKQTIMRIKGGGLDTA